MIAAVIPTRFHPPQLDPLIALLEADGVEVHLLESADYEHRIYRMWNEGVRLAGNVDHIAILNDDITILPGTLPLMARALDTDPLVGVVYPDVSVGFGSLPIEPLTLQATEGSWGRGGMAGFCFMFRAPVNLPVFDESYGWWFGDDDFEERVRAAGRLVCRIRGLPIIHQVDGSARKVWDEKGPIVAADQALWDARHAEVTP
jgi:GT2 family glycosyltransferase